MNIGGNGNLRQMRDHDDLMGLRQVSENGGKRHRRRTANAGIDLVEEKCVDAVRFAERHLDRKHHAADLAARCDARKRAGLHAASGTKHEFNLMGAFLRPLLTRQLAHFAFQGRAAHFKAGHHLRDSPGEARRHLATGHIEHRRRFGEFPLCCLEGLDRRPFPLLRVVDEGDQLRRLLSCGDNIGEARTECAKEPLKRRHAFLSLLKRVAVELDRIAIRQRLAGHVLEHIARLAQRARQISEQLIVARSAFECACRRIERIDGASLTRKRFVGAVRRRHERFGVFRFLETRSKLLVFPFVGNADRVDALEREAGLVEPRRRRLASSFYARKLVSGALRRFECQKVVGVSLANGILRPSVEQGKMRCGAHEGLMLMLATQIERRRDKAGDFLRTCHVAVDRRTRASVDADAAANDRLAIFKLYPLGDVGSAVEEETAFDR